MNDLSTFLDTLTTKLRPEQVFEGNFNHDWKKTSTRWRGLCPTHESSTGTSFYMRPDTLQWYCPKCTVGGGPIQYVSLVTKGTPSPRGKDFIDVAKSLGELVNLPLPERDLSPKERIHAEKLENRRAMLQAVYGFCNAALLNQSKIAKAYVHSRGLTDLDIQSLQLGIFHSTPVIIEHLTSLGFDMDDISECGIAYKNRDGELFSPFESHVTIPWLDEYGRPLTLYGRYMAKKHPEGKNPQVALRNPGSDDDIWLASKKSPLYYDRAKANRSTEVTVVEGLFDAAVLQSRGDNSVIAWVAAHPTEDQLNTLVKHGVKTINLSLDPDEAGDDATFGCIKKLIKRGIIPFVIPRLPEKVDPDEFVLGHGIDAWYELKAKAEHGLKYAAKVITGNASSDKEIQDVIFKAKDLASDLKGFETELNQYFWPALNSHPGISVTPSVETTASNTQQLLNKNIDDEAITFEGALEIVKLLRETYKNEFEFQWNLKTWVRSSGIQQLGINETFLLAAYEAERVPKKPIIEREISYSELCKEPEDQKWIVKGFIPSNSVIVLCAEGGTGKTSLTLDVQRCIATGQPWSGLPTNEGLCYNIQTDSPKSDIKRILNIQSYFNVPADKVIGIHRWSINEWEDLKDRLSIAKPRLVVIDSFTSIHADSGLDLTKSSGGNNLYKFRDYVEDADWEISFMIIHHTNKGGTLRDSSTIKDNVSGLYYMYAPTDELKKKHTLDRYDIVLDIDKSRQGLKGLYKLSQNPLDYSWKFDGLLEENNSFDECIKYLEDNGRSETAPQIAENLSIDIKSAASSLDRASQMGFINCTYKFGEKDKNGNPYRFPVYWHPNPVVSPTKFPQVETTIEKVPDKQFVEF